MWTLLTLLACADKHTETEVAVAETTVTETTAEAPAAETPVATPAPLPTGSRGEVAPVLDAPEAPSNTDAVRDLLLARHSEDLPTRATLEQHEGAREALAWLARYDGQLMVRERALLALGMWSSDAVAAEICADVLGDAEQPPGARAAAAECLANQNLQGDAALRDVVVMSLEDADGRVGAAAAMALAGVADARPALEAAAANTALPEETQAAAARALKFKR